MITNDKLTCAWGIWFQYSSGGDKNQGSKYDSNLDRIYQLTTWADFLYAWKSSNINDPAHYFIDPATGKYNKYDISGEMRKIQAINFFKNDIQPLWEYGDNSKGGYFNFSLPQEISTEKVKQVHENFVFMVIGSASEVCKHILGIRIVDTTLKKNQFRCRIEIWVDYRDDEENLEMMKVHGEEIGEMFKKLEITQDAKIKFYNMGSKSADKKAENKNGNNKHIKNGN